MVVSDRGVTERRRTIDAGVVHHGGRTLLQIPGPTNIPDPVLRAIGLPTLDHRGAEFRAVVRSVLGDLPSLFGTSNPVAVFPSSGTGGWEAALMNLLAPGDRVVVCDNGFFAAKWAALARRLGLDVQSIDGVWGLPADPSEVEAALRADAHHEIRAVLLVHNETSTGVVSDIMRMRDVMDSLHHEALLIVDAVSSVGALPVHHDAWRADVTITGSQKGLMLPPGLSLLAVSKNARQVKRSRNTRVGYWDWDPVLEAAESGDFPFTPASNLIVGLRAALDLILAEGLASVHARHRRLADAVRHATSAWGLSHLCPIESARSDALTTILLPDEVDELVVRASLADRFQLTIGGGLGRLEGSLLRLGHLGDIDELMVISMLAALEMDLPRHWPAMKRGGVDAAMKSLVASSG
jgi:alanine-glyoxylate transaminase/serine-glyoxylate transaminase/serine-pyruvate transaminase